MKARKFRIKVQGAEELQDGTNKTWDAVEKEKLDGSNYDVVLPFSNISWLGTVFSAGRMRMLQVIRDRKPKSINQLAKILGRSIPNVHHDVRILADYGIIKLNTIRNEGLNCYSLSPEFSWDGFDITV